MSKVVWLHTIPGTGTNFMLNLLNAHPEVTVKSLEKEPGIQDTIQCVVEGQLALEHADDALQYSCNTKFLCIQAHLYKPRLAERYWFTDLLEAGYQSPQIIPLRDPARVVATWMAKRAYNPPAVEEVLSRVRWAFEYITRYLEDSGNVFFLPVDFYREKDRQARLRKTRLMFKQVLDLNLTSGVLPIAEEWKPLNNAARMNLIEREGLTDESRHMIEQAFQITGNLDYGRNPFGISGRWDREVLQVYKQNGDLKRLFKRFHYKNLCWF